MSSVRAPVTLTPKNSPGKPIRIAGVVAFLLGPDASYVQGQVIIADGGSNALLDPTRV